jgi:hypothetical protein
MSAPFILLRSVMPLIDSIPMERAVSDMTYGFFLLTYGREEADKLLYETPAEVEYKLAANE